MLIGEIRIWLNESCLNKDPEVRKYETHLGTGNRSVWLAEALQSIKINYANFGLCTTQTLENARKIGFLMNKLFNLYISAKNMQNWKSQ
jgi:hypothetical protein